VAPRLSAESVPADPFDSAATPKSEDVKGGPRKTLSVGMPAAEVQALIGKPQAIEQMDTPEGRADVWVYRRLKESVTTSEYAGEKPITKETIDGVGRVITDVVASEAIMRPMRKDTYEVVRVLIFKGVFVNLRKSVETKQTWL